MGAFKVDTTHWPVVVVTFPDSFAEADVDGLVKLMAPLYPRAAQSGLVTVNVLPDAGERAPLKVRAYLVRAGDKAAADHPGAKLAEAVVASSPLVRSLVSAHYFLRSQKVLNKTFAQVDEAIAWGKSVLSIRGRT